MNKKNITLLISMILFMTSCSTSTSIHSKYQQSIEQKQDKMQQSAKVFLAKATKMLSDKSKPVDMKTVQKLLETSESLLNVTVDDTMELDNLSDKDLNKEIDDTLKEAKEDKQTIADLRIKEQQEVDKMVTDNIAADTIRKYERAKTLKLYAICATILTALGALFYFFPSKFIGIGSSIIGFFFKR